MKTIKTKPRQLNKITYTIYRNSSAYLKKISIDSSER